MVVARRDMNIVIVTRLTSMYVLKREARANALTIKGYLVQPRPSLVRDGQVTRGVVTYSNGQIGQTGAYALLAVIEIVTSYIVIIITTI